MQRITPASLGSDETAIVAQCTPRGSGALALIRLSGANALDVATRMSKLASKKTIATAPSHTIEFGWVVNEQQQHIDQVLFFIMHGPRTFTGENVVEITCHNNLFLIEQIIERAIHCGARLAREGEFTQRAFLNNKIDLIQAEAINDLIHANTQLSLKKSLSQLEGSFSHWATKIEQQLMQCLALSDASFEFLEDEAAEFSTTIATTLQTVLDDIASLKKTFDQQQHIRQGIRIVLIGSVNAGKSSLFNALVGQDRAIVTNIAGTTRDMIETGLYKDGNYWTLVDTAGLRNTHDVIEQEGIRRSFEQAQKADIIVLVYDGSRPMTEHEQSVYETLLSEHAGKTIIVRNKIDLPHSNSLHFFADNVITTSSTTEQGIDELEDAIKRKIAKLLSSLESPFLLNKRHYSVMLNLEQQLYEVQNVLSSKPVAYEILSLRLKDALESLSELTGATISQAGMDTVFKQFCIGK